MTINQHLHNNICRLLFHLHRVFVRVRSGAPSPQLFAFLQALRPLVKLTHAPIESTQIPVRKCQLSLVRVVAFLSDFKGPEIVFERFLQLIVFHVQDTDSIVCVAENRVIWREESLANLERLQRQWHCLFNAVILEQYASKRPDYRGNH